MKTQKIVIVFMTLIAFATSAQHIGKQNIFVATTEQDMYKLYEQMLDSVMVSNRFLSPSGGTRDDHFAIGWFKEIGSKDTIMKFVQRCDWTRLEGNYICDRFYRSYISNAMPIDFYERLLNYFKKVGERENYLLKQESTNQLPFIANIIMNQYESGQLNRADSIKARVLIEETILRLITDAHAYQHLKRFGREVNKYDKYVTDTIRQALINVLENPFYPTEYLGFYMSFQDTTSIDTIGIPPNIRPIWKAQFTPEELEVYEKERRLYQRLQLFLLYERIGREEYDGLSAGQAYLRRKREGFREQGYLPINNIADYAHEKQDELLIKHLKEFKKRHPDYPLRHF